MSGASPLLCGLLLAALPASVFAEPSKLDRHIRAARVLIDRGELDDAAEQLGAAAQLLEREGELSGPACEVVQLAAKLRTFSLPPGLAGINCQSSRAPSGADTTEAEPRRSNRPAFDDEGEKLFLLGHFQPLHARLSQLAPRDVKSLSFVAHLAAARAELADAPLSACTDIGHALRGVDEALSVGMDRLCAQLSVRQFREASRLASMLSAGLDASVAEIVLRLPRSVLASDRLSEALSAARRGDYGRGHRALTATGLAAPWVQVPSQLASEIRRGRIRALHTLSERAAAEHSYEVAFGYLLALHEIDSEREAAARDLSTFGDTVAAGLRQRWSISATGAGAEEETVRFSRALFEALRIRLPSFVDLAVADPAAPFQIRWAWSKPKRALTTQVEARAVSVDAYEVTVSNPKWRSALSSYEQAERDLEDAEGTARALHADALRNASRISGLNVGSLIAGIAATTEETAAVATQASAQQDLAKAAAVLRSTPKTRQAKRTKQATYYAIVGRAEATSRFIFSLSTPETVGTSRSASFSVDHGFEEVLPAMGLPIEASRADWASVPRLEPDRTAHVSELATKLASLVRATMEQRLWTAVEEAAAGGNTRATVVAIARYLAYPDALEERRGPALHFLSEALP